MKSNGWTTLRRNVNTAEARYGESNLFLRIFINRSMSDCIFCDIVNNKTPSWIIHQDNEVICFLTKTLSSYAHTVIATKQHVLDIYSVPEAVLLKIVVVSKKLAIHYRSKIDASGVNILHASGIPAQQSVLHFHIHLIPRFNNDGLNAWPDFPVQSFDKDEIVAKLRY